MADFPDFPDFPEMRPIAITFGEVDPEVLGLLTGGVMGSAPPPEFAVDISYPIKRTFWQWLRRKPRQWTRVYVPRATMAREED